MRYFGFAIADSMLPSGFLISKRSVPIDELKERIDSFTSCVNPSHQATIDAIRERYDLNIPVPESAPTISLSLGDSLAVMSVRGLPRGEHREWTREEIERATFECSEYQVVAMNQ